MVRYLIHYIGFIAAYLLKIKFVRAGMIYEYIYYTYISVSATGYL